MFNEKSRSVIWTVAGGYLLYLGDQLLTQWFSNETDYPLVSISAGLIFVGFGGFLLFMAWKKWRAQEQEEKNEE